MSPEAGNLNGTADFYREKVGVTWKMFSCSIDHTSLELWRSSNISNFELFKGETACYRRCALTSQSGENSFFSPNLVS